ncbi:MAG: thioredoxin family protein [Desulfovibrionaceae bacterium]
MEQLTDATYEARLAATEGGVLIFFKKLCPHCKNMEKVMEKFHVLVPQSTLLALDIEENPISAAALGVERPPTLLIIKGGKTCAQKVGLMNPKELVALYQNA